MVSRNKFSSSGRFLVQAASAIVIAATALWGPFCLNASADAGESNNSQIVEKPILLRQYSEAYRIGDDEAGLALADILIGEGALRDVPRAREVLEQLVAKDNTKAMLMLATILEKEEPLDIPRSRLILERLANAGDSGIALEAALRFAVSLREDPADLLEERKRSRELLDRFVSTGNPDIAYYLALMLIGGKGGPQDLSRGCMLLEEAAKETPEARMSFFFTFRYGINCPKDIVRARQLLEKSAPDLHPALAFELALMLHQGNGGARDMQAARALYERTAATGHTTATNNLAYMMKHGLGGEKDIVRARELFEQAITSGSEEAVGNLAVMLALGQGGPADEAEARALVKLFRETKDETEIKRFSIMLFGKEHDAESRTWAGTGAMDKDAKAFFILGKMHPDGESGPMDDVKIRKLLEEAVAAGSKKDLFPLGLMLMLGEGGEKDIARGKMLLEKTGLKNLSDTLGEAAIEVHDRARDLGQARKFLELAYELGDQRVGILLARELIFGEERDLVRARAMLEKLALAGEPEAMGLLSICL